MWRGLGVRRPFPSHRLATDASFPESFPMKGADSKRSEEPVGIVISGPLQPIESTVFVAYVWGPAPTLPTQEEPKAA